MKKYITLALIFLLCPLMLVGCGGKSSLEDNISEITKIYYKGADENNNVNASISIGSREDPYIIDGIHNKMCDFSLFAINFNKQLDVETINVELTINGSVQDFEMYLNPVNHFYMADLGYSLNSNDEVNIKYEEFNISFYNVSDEFAISYQDALNIAKENLKDKLDDFYDSNTFMGECYLKILTEYNEDFEDLFWYFSIVGQNNKALNVVISVEDGAVLVE